MRQTGTTTQQIMAAPEWAVYVWCGEDLYYPKSIARKLHRPDIHFVAPGWLDHPERFREREVILDHDCQLSERQMDNWLIYVRRHNERSVG